MRLAIIGTGYVGLTTGVCLAAVGHDVICVDVLPERVAKITQGLSPFYEPGLDELLTKTLASGKLSATTNLADAVKRSEITLITVGTPQGDGKIDLSYIEAAAREVGAALRDVDNYHVVAVKSTVVPATTDTLVRKSLEETSGRRAGDFGICMNPEFLREGSAIGDFNRPDRIVVGQWDERSGRVLAEMYAAFDCPKLFTTLRNAEMIKYAANSLLATLISFSNEIAALCEVTPETDVETVLQGVCLDRRISPQVNNERITPDITSFIRAGCGYGGSCLPKDVNALRNYARERAVTPELLDSVVSINTKRPEQLVGLIQTAVGALGSSTIAVLGLAFKPDTDDLRESPSVAVIKLLQARGAAVKVYDPIFKSVPESLRELAGVSLFESMAEVLQGVDAAVVITSWPEFRKANWSALTERMKRPIVIDGRNFLRGVSWPAGVTYLSIGQVAEIRPRAEEPFSAVT
jgi:UDPglucose 6-dehydrogenase